MFGPLATAPLSDAPFSTFCSAKIAINRPKIVRAKSPMALQVSKGSTMRLPPSVQGVVCPSAERRLFLGGGTTVPRRRDSCITAERQGIGRGGGHNSPCVRWPWGLAPIRHKWRRQGHSSGISLLIRPFIHTFALAL